MSDGEVPTEPNETTRKHRHLVWLALGVGTLLTIIGIRFLIVPRTAAHNFGLAKDLTGYELHYLVGLRDIWLGTLAIAFALLREWRALMLWFATAAVVCFADAGLAASSSGKWVPTAFHLGSGFFCAAMALAIRARIR